MKTFIMLVVAGLAWLGLVKASDYLDIQPQLVTLARSGYVGMFSIFLMIELRKDLIGGTGKEIQQGMARAEFAWFLVPLISVAILAIFSRDFAMTPKVIATICVFYACQLCIFILRERCGQIRSAYWDIAPPIVLVGMLSNPYLLAITAFISGVVLVKVIADADSTGTSRTADALIVQLPSLCLAPVLLIAIRDIFDFGGMFSRANVEVYGLIVNGVGAAVWTALVMRAEHRLALTAHVLWIVGCAITLMLLLVNDVFIGSAGAILVAEIFRGTLWTGTTHLLRKVTRWHGFLINLLATSLPFFALWFGREMIEPRFIMFVFCAFHLAIPLMLFFDSIKRQHNGLFSRTRSQPPQCH